MLLAALTNILHPVLPETIDHRTWTIEHTGWRLQDEACVSQPGDPHKGGSADIYTSIYFFTFLYIYHTCNTPHMLRHFGVSFGTLSAPTPEPASNKQRYSRAEFITFWLFFWVAFWLSFGLFLAPGGDWPRTRRAWHFYDMGTLSQCFQGPYGDIFCDIVTS